MPKVLCRLILGILAAAPVVLAIGLFPHPTPGEAQAMMYVTSAIAILALGAMWRPKRA